MDRCPLCLGEHHTLFYKTGQRSFRSCPGCRLIFLSPDHRLDAAAEKARYLLHENRPGDPDYRRFLNRLAEPLVRKLHGGEEGLDYGSGPGPALPVMLQEQGFSMRVFDPFFAPDTAVLERKYDFITCTETFEHFYRPEAELKRLDGMLKPGAWLAVMTRMPGSDDEFPGWFYHRDPTHVCFYREETMSWIGERLGWQVEFPEYNVVFFRKGTETSPSGRTPTPIGARKDYDRA